MTFPHRIDYRHWSRAVAEMMRRSQRHARHYRYTQPTPTDEGVQDTRLSALCAVAYRWLNSELAGDELVSALACQPADGPEAGMLPAAVRWDTGEASAEPTVALVGYAAVQIYHVTGDYPLLERLYPRLRAYGDWLAKAPLDEPHHRYDRVTELEAIAHVAHDMGNRADHDRWEALARTARETADASDHPRALLAGCATPAHADALASRARADIAQGRYPLASDGVVSVETNWFAYLGLRRYGHDDLARMLAERTFRLVEANGFYAAYDAAGGAGIGEANTPVAGLALDLLARELQGRPAGAQCI